MLTRRGFLAGSASSIVAACARPPRGPTLLATVPSVTHGVQAGATGRGAAIVWARASEPARMIVEWDTTPRFERPTAIAGPVVGPETDHTGKVELTGLPDGQTIAYRVKFVREAARGDGAWVSGKLVRTRADRLRVAWTGDTCGQGFGRNPEWGGLRGYAAIRAAQPDLFIHSGDLIYADNPILPELALPDGRIWRNISHERIARPAESLEDFRARYAYNLEDEHVRALSADVPSIMQWDDHEVRNNWWPGQQLDDPRYRSERDASRLAERVR
ncbi:MAG: alkaline phosphatase D family protein, partial [Kofleriaceae bacterium]